MPDSHHRQLRTARVAGLATLIVLSLTVTLGAQDPGTDEVQDPQSSAQEESQPTTGALISYRDSNAMHAVVEVGTGIGSFLGDVEIFFRGRRLRCDALVVWFGEEAVMPGEQPARDGFSVLPRDVTELYAEGTVIYEAEGAEQVIRCDRFYLDLRTERGLVVDAVTRVQVAPKSGERPISIRATELRLLGRNRIEAIEARVRPSELENSDLELSTDRVVVLDETGPDGPIRRLELRGNEARVRGLPVLWVPDFAIDQGAANRVFLIEEVRLGSSSEFGFQAGVTLGTRIGSTKDGVRWHPSIDIDYLSKRGFGFGANLEYIARDFVGNLALKYQRDEGTDRRFGTPSTRDRGRVAFLHRHFLPEDVIVDLEANIFSDRGYYPTFEEELDKTVKPPETLIHVRKAWQRHRIAALFSHRSNDFDTLTEARPEVRYDLVSEPLGTVGGAPLTWNVTARVGNMRRRFDEATDQPQRTSVRADLDQILETSIPVGPIRVRPFVGLRTSWFEEDFLGARDRSRIGFTSGVTLSTDLSRDYEAEGGFFELDGLRHRILPEITFSQTVGVDGTSQDLIAFDEVERYDDERFIGFRVRNLFLTRRSGRDGPVVDPVLDIEIEQRLQLSGTPRDDGDFFQPLDVDLLVRIGPQIDIVSDFEFDWDSGFDVFNVGVGWIPSDRLQVYTGFRHFEDVYDAWFLEGRTVFDEKWLARFRVSFDFEESRALDHRLTLTRKGVEWVTQFIVGYDGGEEDFFVGFSLAPILFWNPRDESPVLRREPRLGNLRDARYR